MRPLSKSLILLALLVCAGCAKPSDISVARRDHLLTGPHGWIDITLHAPVAASGPGAMPTAGPAAAASAARPSTSCNLGFTINGETLMQESADLAQADAARNPIGYRFVVPAGVLNARLSVSNCVKDELGMALSVALEKNHVALLEFDGQRLAVTSTAAWEPASLEAVRGDVAALHQHGEATDGALSTLTRLALASVALDIVVIAVVIGAAIRRRSR